MFKPDFGWHWGVVLWVGGVVSISSVGAVEHQRMQGSVCRAPFEVSAAGLGPDRKELSLTIRDQKEVANACNYAVTRFEYLAAIHTLVLNLDAPEPCFLDRIGKREALWKWTLPSSLSFHEPLSLIVNGKKVSKLLLGQEAVVLDCFE